MKLISARQAWRDALHEGRDSVLAAAAARAELGKEGRVIGETMPSMLDSNGRCAHMLAAGLVQSAIGTLPKPLQHFGHALYSPVATGQDLNIAHGLVWFTTELPECSARRREIAYWLALAAIKSHQAFVFGREGWGPIRVCEFINSWYGTKMNPCNWARDWAVLWDAIAKAIDKLDAKALKPVAAVIVRMSERKEPGWCRWDRHDREAVADVRAESYDKRRTGAVIALQARLGKMDEHQLRRWFKRMRAYAAAYRNEWDRDVIENAHRHQLYLDRVTEYWSQRQRVGDVTKRVA
ncbi:hypothetical protein C4K14_2159 [Pseudomonas chlororaphis subsp. aureofaciens]|uniref:hypothetical protein n=1 Tax=Pseudomonas chlororaphis TaxID=587753 RepID=UPI000F585CFD|nr:hypothetical protein [Pseudomonas chlororaphis]AZD84993.1 hypothetical protein C4K14_2159 [Pseudomonas chlororaphis subsp. aureofaciens]